MINQPTDTDTTSRCTKCGKKKLTDMFPADRKVRCSECIAEYQQHYRDNNKDNCNREQWNEYQKRYRREHPEMQERNTAGKKRRAMQKTMEKINNGH